MATTRPVDDFMALLGRHQSRLMGFIYALVQNMDDTEDLYQQTCLVMWRKFEQYQPDTDFMAWACQIARFEVLNFLRRAASQRICFSEEFLAELAIAPGPISDEQSRQQALADCRQELPPPDQQLLTRRYSGAETVLSIAADLQRSPQSICNTLGRIRRALLACIERKLKTEAAGG